MSSENVERVRRWHAALNAGPEAIRASVAELFDREIDYYPVRKFPEAAPCHSRDELSRFVTQFADAYRLPEWVLRDVIDVGGDRLLSRTTLRAEGRGSGMRLEGDVYHCYWLRHGRFFRVEDHLTLRGALHAFGFDAETLEGAGLRTE